MKWLTLSLFLLGYSTTFGQYIYVQSSEPFTLQNSSGEHSLTSAWIKLLDYSEPVLFKLKDDKALKRYFKPDVKPSLYVIDGNAIRYRPNMKVVQSDTIEQSTVIAIPKRDLSAMTSTIAEIKAMKYEYEKVEAVKKTIEGENLSCQDIQQLINCVKYDASKVDLINLSAQYVSTDCFKELKQLVAESYRSSINK